MLNHSGTYENEVYDHQGLLLVIFKQISPTISKGKVWDKKGELVFQY